jgi:hypothetical protein
MQKSFGAIGIERWEHTTAVRHVPLVPARIYETRVKLAAIKIVPPESLPAGRRRSSLFPSIVSTKTPICQRFGRRKLLDESLNRARFVHNRAGYRSFETLQIDQATRAKSLYPPHIDLTGR